MAFGSLPRVGGSGVAVGYGGHSPGETGQKYSASEELVSIGEHSVEMSWGDGRAYSGDSGGPLLVDERIAATVSCGVGKGPDAVVHYERVDQPEAMTWIQSVIDGWT